MSLPRVVTVAPGSPAERAGLVPGDEVVTVGGRVPRDVLEWRLLVDDADPELDVRRGGLDRGVTVPKRAGEALGVEVHGQVVVCPGINDGDVLASTLVGVLDEYPELSTLCVVPLGISDHSDEASMRPHTIDEACAVVDLVERWQQTYLRLLGRRL